MCDAILIMMSDDSSRNVFEFLIRVVHGVALCGKFEKAKVIVTVTEGNDFLIALTLSHMSYAIGFGAFAVMNIQPGETLCIYGDA